jgi:hypothetical protein
MFAGSKKWYIHGSKHRDGGQPAVIHASGDQKWDVTVNNGQYG